MYKCVCIYSHRRVYPTSGKIDFFPPPLFPRRRRRRFMCVQYPNAISLSNDKTTGKIIFTSHRLLYDFFAHIKRKHASKYDFAPYITHTGRLYKYIYKYCLVGAADRGCAHVLPICNTSTYTYIYLYNTYNTYAFYFYPCTHSPTTRSIVREINANASCHGLTRVTYGPLVDRILSYTSVLLHCTRLFRCGAFENDTSAPICYYIFVLRSLQTGILR